MRDPYPVIEIWENPTPEQMTHSAETLVQQLTGPLWISIEGTDTSRCRVITTLLHGNEPSGLYALHEWICAGHKPAVTLHCFIGAVTAAQTAPLFSHRHLSDQRDLNRCFRPPFDGEQGGLAKRVLQRIESLHPECAIDIHNTSGAGPAFAVSIQLDQEHQRLAQHFTHRLVLTELLLGAFMEMTHATMPVITIECGGAHEQSAHQVAAQGLDSFARSEDPFQPTIPQALDIYRHPLRLEIAPGTSISYGREVNSGKDLTIISHIEQFNFGIVTPSQPLAWLPVAMNNL
ncbi:MAG TPA: hypothetical protein DCZ03_04675, partial [Gammaproteobacteria bacterium]|nr:hypothetical protein [Gammaproteobacteria bacterium]